MPGINGVYQLCYFVDKNLCLSDDTRWVRFNIKGLGYSCRRWVDTVDFPAEGYSECIKKKKNLHDLKGRPEKSLGDSSK